MPYNKKEVLDVGDATFNLLKGLHNGVGGEEVSNLTKVLIEAGEASHELRTDFDAAGLHIMGRLADKFGDEKVNPETPV